MAQLHFLIVEDEIWDTERICKALSERFGDPALTCIATAEAALRLNDINHFTANHPGPIVQANNCFACCGDSFFAPAALEQDHVAAD